jgi:hypothetical protein
VLADEHFELPPLSGLSLSEDFKLEVNNCQAVDINRPLLTEQLCSIVVRGGVLFLIKMSPVADQDLGKPIDLSYDTIDLVVFWITDRDLGQGSGEEMTSRA